MMSLVARFQQNLERLVSGVGDQPLLLAVSGGLDSVVLLHLCLEVQWPLVLAHCNFQLRGAESDGDEAFVRQLATAKKLSCHVKAYNTLEFSENNNVSIQMAARELRYAWFEELREQTGCAFIATAHHLDDALETVLLNFVRGSDLNGLRGIPERQNQVIRPLLFATRAELEAYAAENQLQWREDSSNAEHDYARNLLRHQVMPVLKQLNPALLQTAARNMAQIGESTANYDFLLQQFLGQKDDHLSPIDREKLQALPHPANALKRLIRPHGFTPEQARQAAEHRSAERLILENTAGERLVVDEKSIQWLDKKQAPEPIRIEADDLMLRLPDGRQLFQMHVDAETAFPDGKSAILVDAAKLQFPLSLRPLRPGDRFQPFGMGGQSQKLQDFCTNLKLGPAEREQALLLVDAQDRPVWLLGYRADERFRVQAHTQQRIKFVLSV
ncbi:MAG: tRNA lysidine(34) synthetase TilS [Chitinophagales bacterium]|nr:tRNA lysidine(34) synthetase TilS [Chitinophagales bacterium]